MFLVYKRKLKFREIIKIVNKIIIIMFYIIYCNINNDKYSIINIII